MWVYIYVHDIGMRFACCNTLPGRLPRMVTSYSGFEDFADAVQAQTVKTTGEGWQALSDECKAGSEGLGK